MTQANIRVGLVAVMCFSGVLFSFSLFAQQKAPDCKCRAPGGAMRDLGTVECVRIGGTAKLVTCAMSTNTPYWKDIENVEGCPTA
ncbi:MAG: hypothetical protein AB8B64_22715 [Granulosicoccus sp.]